MTHGQKHAFEDKVGNGWELSSGRLPVAERRSSDVLLLSSLIIHCINCRNSTDDSLQEGSGGQCTVSWHTPRSGVTKLYRIPPISACNEVSGFNQ